jgi:putative ATP-dependent endonuclease of OLD family
MYLSELKLWNFRKYGMKGDKIEEAKPGLTVKFKKGLNLLVGENDSGKTAIIDAVKHVLYTQIYEFLRLEDIDFFKPEKGKRTENLKIECIFRGFEPSEAANFLEWIGFEENKGKQEYVLKIRLTARNHNNRIISDVKAGPDEVGTQLDGTARDLLRVTYLKPLRDAESELTPGYRNRFAQILKSDKLFQKKKNEKDEKHVLETYIEKANDEIKSFFKKDSVTYRDVENGEERESSAAKPIMDKLNGFLEEFFPEGSMPAPFVGIAGSELSDILSKLSLKLEEHKAGLGSLNLLYIAAELLLLQRENHTGLKLALIEELEAHLHPPAQLRLIEFLQKEENERKGQYILSSHSTTLASSIKLNNLIICKGVNVFPMGNDNTQLFPGDYKFLERFLDATKANLFFARGVILVEGDAENLLIPTLAKIIDRPLHRHGVSIVNVGGKAFLRYSKIFLRKDTNEPEMEIPVSVITDLDVKPKEYYEGKGNSVPDDIPGEKKRKKPELEKKYCSGSKYLKACVSNNWTLEYEIALSSLREVFYSAVLVAKKIKNKDDYEFDGNIPGDIEKEVTKNFTNWEGLSDEEKAYEIYKPLLNHNASKAVTAQCFAQILLNKKEEVKKIIETDENWEYLLDAIHHVTPKPIE